MVTVNPSFYCPLPTAVVVGASRHNEIQIDPISLHQTFRQGTLASKRHTCIVVHSNRPNKTSLLRSNMFWVYLRLPNDKILCLRRLAGGPLLISRQSYVSTIYNSVNKRDVKTLVTSRCPAYKQTSKRDVKTSLSCLEMFQSSNGHEADLGDWGPERSPGNKKIYYEYDKNICNVKLAFRLFWRNWGGGIGNFGEGEFPPPPKVPGLNTVFRIFDDFIGYISAIKQLYVSSVSFQGSK